MKDFVVVVVVAQGYRAQVCVVYACNKDIVHRFVVSTPVTRI